MDQEILTRFEALVAGPADQVPLDESLLLAAAHIDRRHDPAEQQARLDDLAAGVPAATPEGVRDHLFTTLGFQGDRDQYYDPRNSLLPEVLDRRLGIPITLAAVAMEVGRRCDVAFAGIGMPGHFLLGVEHQPGRYLDPFDGGTELDEDACRARFEQLQPGAPWHPEHLAPTPPTAIVARVLANLAGAYRRAGDAPGLCSTLELRLLLPGAAAEERRELGVLLGAAGRFGEGARVLEASPDRADQEAALRLRARMN